VRVRVRVRVKMRVRAGVRNRAWCCAAVKTTVRSDDKGWLPAYKLKAFWPVRCKKYTWQWAWRHTELCSQL
jgi:hypothetical protein